ncbi:MAG: CAP domain-containing protein [Gemmataceae bacterium]
MARTHCLSSIRSVYLEVIQFEERCVPTTGTNVVEPSPMEQVLLERLNDARADPVAYGNSIGLDLSYVSPTQPLAFDTRLIAAAQAHSQDMNDARFFSHYSSTGAPLSSRVVAAGYPELSSAESIAAGFATAEGALEALIVDKPIPSLSHRRHLLAIDQAFKSLDQVGVGIVEGGSGPYVNYFTIDTATSRYAGSFLTGVVYNDANGNGKYDAGEGVDNVSVEVSGVGTYDAYSTGGYSVPLTAGTYQVTFRGENLPGTVTKTVTVGNQNVRLNILTNQETFDTGGNSSRSPVSNPGTPTLPPPVDDSQADRNAAEAWVVQLADTLWTRTPTSAETSQWVDAVMTGESKEAIINEFMSHPEFERRQLVDWVSQIGANILNRSLTESEADLWVRYLEQGGSKTIVVFALMGNQGYHYYSNSAWISKLSEILLQRSLTAHEHYVWTWYLARTWTRFYAIESLLESTEHQRVQATYKVNNWSQTLGRSLSSLEQSNWASYLANGGSEAVFLTWLTEEE